MSQSLLGRWMPALLLGVAASGFVPAAQAQNIDAGKPAAKSGRG